MVELSRLNGFEIVDAKAREDIEALKNAELNLDGYATENYVKNAIAEAELSGSEVDLSGYASKDDVPTRVSQLHNDRNFITLKDVPKQDLSKYVLEAELELKGYLTEHQDISGKADVNHTHPEYLTEHQDISGKADIDHKHPEYLTEHQSLEGYATEQYVKDAIAEVKPEEIDLSEYAKKTDIPDVSGFISEIPSEYITESELDAKGYLTEHQDISGKADIDHKHSEYLTEHQSLEEYAKKTDIPDVSNFITEIPAEYITETELNDKGYLTEHQSLTDYAKKEDIPDVSKFITEIPEEYVTDSELNEKGYLTEHQSLEGKADKEHTHPEYLTEHQSLEGLATEDYVDTKVTLFHAALDASTMQYVKDSADFTYTDVVATENCKIEATFGNVKIILNKEVHRNIESDPIAGRYVEFSALLRSGYKTFKLFLFVYDPENLPTDEVNVSRLEDYGDSQYCSSAAQTIIMGEFLDRDITANRNNDTNAPSTKAAGDYTDSQCGVVLDYMQTTFATNIMALVADAYGPHIIYDNPTGFEASNDDVGDWQLNNLDLTPYKRLKFYVKAGGDSNDNRTPMHVVEMHLDDRCKSSIGFTAGHMTVNPNNRNRIHCVTFAVNEPKTAIQFVAANSLYGTASTSSSGGRRCYLIEGYKI